MTAARRATSDARIALLLFLSAASVYVAVMFGATENPDAEVEFQTSRSLLEEGSLALGDTPAARAIVEREFDVRRGADGRAYSWFGVGRAVLGVPFLVAGRAAARILPGLEAGLERGERFGVPNSEGLAHFAFSAMGPLAAAGCIALVFLLARALGAGRGAALAAAALLGGTSFFLPHARSSLGDTTGALFLWAALLFALRGPSSRGNALAAAAAGAAVAVRPLNLIAIFPILVLLVLRARRGGWRAAAPGFAVLAAFAVALGGTNVARFGNPLEFGYGAAVGSGSYFSFPLWLGLAGILGSPGRGLVFYAPAAILAAPGARALWREGRKAPALLLLATVACVVVPPSFTEGWHGGHAYGPRYALPALGPLLALAASSFAVPRARRAAPVLGILGFLACAPGVLTPYPAAIDKGVRIVERRFPEVPENSRFQYLLFHPRLAPPVLHLSLLREVSPRDHFGWLRLAGVEGYGFLAAIPLLLLGLGAACAAGAVRVARRRGSSPEGGAPDT